MNLDQELSRIERTLWTNDAETYRRTFLPDAVIIFPEIGRTVYIATCQARWQYRLA